MWHLRGNAILDIGKSQAMLIRNEQIPGEILTPGEQERNETMMMCVSRAEKGCSRLVLDA